jgi:hypothetical protein
MRWHALGISDEIDSQPKKARKSTFRLGRKLGFPSSLKFGEQRDRNFLAIPGLKIRDPR